MPDSPLDQLVAATTDRLAVLGQRRADGMATAEWRMVVQAALRDAHIAAGALARSGFENLDKSTTGFIGARLRNEYDHLAVLALDTAPGEFDGRAMARLAQYGNGAVRGTASAVTRRDAAEGDQERNLLSEGSNSCDECQELTDQGLVPVGTLPEIGSRTCAGNCSCEIEVVTADVGAESAA